MTIADAKSPASHQRNTTMKSMQQTILEQISPAKNGNALGRLTAMIGAKNFVILPAGVRFNFARSQDYWVGVQITLTNNDTYDMRFWKAPGKRGLTVSDHTGSVR